MIACRARCDGLRDRPGLTSETLAPGRGAREVFAGAERGLTAEKEWAAEGEGGRCLCAVCEPTLLSARRRDRERRQGEREAKGGRRTEARTTGGVAVVGVGAVVCGVCVRGSEVGRT